MLQGPDLSHARIATCLQVEYGLAIAQITFLPLGADLNTAVYRAVAEDGTPYFLKLRRDDFDETAVTLPKYLSDQGLGQIIAPLATQAGQLWAGLDQFKAIVYPFVEGHDGYEVDLSDRQWIEFGATVRRIHAVVVPPSLVRRIQQEAYSPRGREIVREFLARVETDTFPDPEAASLAGFLRDRRGVILDLVARAEGLAQALQTRPPEFVLCHSDLHAGNILLAATGALFIVDWDNPILAPRERDLMYPGGGQFGGARAPQDEEALFYRGYGPTPIDPAALAYYRYERIVQDIAVYCRQLFCTDEGGEDRAQSLKYLASTFLPSGTIEIAYRSDRTR